MTRAQRIIKEFDKITGIENLNLMSEVSGTTSEDQGHSHDYSVDSEGNGETMSTSAGDNHVHKIASWKVYPSKDDGHSHTIEREDKGEEN